ncbi:MAG: chlorite dismutase family protein [Armatimonadetes bacterium]|nr:chlorite dismutase family protein [Armatimonadota bacterium]
MRPTSSESPSAGAVHGQGRAPLPRQYVLFTFYKIDPAWRRLSAEEKQKGKDEFLSVLEDRMGGTVMTHTYSTVGLRANAELVLWRIASDLEPLQEMTARLLSTGLGAYLESTDSLLGQTKRSVYVDKLNPEHEESRIYVRPAQSKYIFIYPFVKTRAWYQMSKHARQGVMDEHIEVGNRYPSVKLNTIYSFGLDDQEFVVAFETDHPSDFLDLVMELRETEGSLFTERDTPIYTAILRSFNEAVEMLG